MDILTSMYSDTSEDVKQCAWKEFYIFRIKEGEPFAPKNEEFEITCKKLGEAGDKLPEAAIISRLLSTLPAKYSSFRIAWECIPEVSGKKDNLVARILGEEKCLLESDEENAEVLTLLIQAIKLKEDYGVEKNKKKQRTDRLKKCTKCTICKEKGDWARECPRNRDRESNPKVRS